MLTCTICKEYQPKESFHINSRSKTGRTSACKKCRNRTARNSSVRKLYTLNYRNIQQNNDFLRKFGITTAQYNKLLTDQLHQCAICRTPQENLKRRLAVDHCHETMTVRGLLCFRCNAILGSVHDKISILESAIKYLKTKV